MIRRFKTEDAEQCSKIMLDCIENSLDYKGENKDFMIKMSSPEKIIEKSEKMDFFVFVKTNKILATGGFNNGEIKTMFVSPVQQKKGIGKEMLFFLIEHAKSLRYKKVFLKASPEAEGFYEKHGFIKIKDRYDHDFHVVEMEMNID